jgi:hypothetical protein
MGANVESDFSGDGYLHTFALSKGANSVGRQNRILTIKKKSKGYEEDDFRHCGNASDDNEC